MRTTLLRRSPLPVAVLGGLLLALAPASHAKTSHEGWPKITGVLLMNKLDQSRPLDARPGMNLFGGADATYSCDGLHDDRSCAAPTGTVARRGHNKLLGGHGSDAIFAGSHGDVIWGDYKPSGQPSGQVDTLVGGPGKDFMYASHGHNRIAAGGGDDYVKAHFGRGAIDCGRGRDTLYISRRAERGYSVRGCERISHRSLGY